MPETLHESSANASAPTTLHRRTCPLCEGMCGLLVNVQAERVISIRPDPNNSFSRGHICPKGTTLGDVHHDPDRLRQPMIRDGSVWREATWDEAFARIETLVAGVRERHGPDAFACYSGNMNKGGFDTSRYLPLMARQARFAQRFSSSTVDQLPKNVSTHLMYGDMWKVPIPDIDHTDLFVILGGNPAASKGSMFSHRDVMGAIKALRARGGRVIVIDPVRTGTAQAADQWIGLRPGSDAALLLAVVQVLFADGLVRLGPLDGLVNGVDRMEALARDWPPERVAAFCGVDAATIRTLAHQIAAAPRAAVYGRIGTCTQAFGTLASWLVDVVAVLTGNLDREGGTMWSTQVAPHLKLTPPYPANAPLLGAPNRSRGVRAVLGQYPASCLAEEIDTPGPGQIHGLVTTGCNPVLSAPGSARLEAALPLLDAMICVDLYLNETTRHAHVVLPALSPLEQPHWDVWSWPFSLTSGGNYASALFSPTHRPEEWRVLARLGAIIGGDPKPDLDALDDAYFATLCRQLGVDAERALAEHPARGAERILDLCIRSGPFGDRHGERPDGVTLQTFKDQPDGLIFGHAQPQGAAAYSTPSGRLELAPQHMLDDLPRLEAALRAPAPPFVLVSRRHIRSLNSWMHNLETLVKGRDRCTLQIHVDDAARLGMAPGDIVRIESASGVLDVAAEPTPDIRPGVVSLPHGWGHDRPGAQLQIARQHAGVNINRLSPGTLVDAASGNAVLNGIAVTINRLGPAALATP
jgi:anaerobic selenocysteine-containing dehydrogenase